jgi:hypothetical protein
LSDPLSTIGSDIGILSSGLSIAQNTYGFLNFIRGVKGTDVIAALFDEQAHRTDGSNKIEVVTIPTPNNPKVWWYTIKELNGYVFDRVALTTSCVSEQAAPLILERDGDTIIREQPCATHWRWYATPQAGAMFVGTGYHPNVLVKFIVVGYKPKALLKYFTS